MTSIRGKRGMTVFQAALIQTWLLWSLIDWGMFIRMPFYSSTSPISFTPAAESLSTPASWCATEYLIPNQWAGNWARFRQLWDSAILWLDAKFVPAMGHAAHICTQSIEVILFIALKRCWCKLMVHKEIPDFDTGINILISIPLLVSAPTSNWPSTSTRDYL